MADYYGEQEQQPAGHHKKHRQQQYEGEDAPAAQFEHMGNQAGGYNPGGGGYGGNQQFPQPHQRPPRDEYAPPQAEYYGGGGGGGGYGGPGEYERPRPTGFEGEGEQFPEHRQQRHQQQQHHPGGEYGGERPHRGEQRGEYDAPPPSEYGSRQGQGYAPEGGRQGYGQGGGGYARDDDDQDRRGGYGGGGRRTQEEEDAELARKLDEQDRRGGYGGGGRRTQEEEDAELAKKLDADINHGGDLDAAGSQASRQQFHPPQGSPPGGGAQSGGQQFRRPQGAPPSGGDQYGGQQFHRPQGAPPSGGDQYGGQQYHPSQAPPQSYSHIPALAAEHDEDTDPEVYHQAIQKLQKSQSQGPPAEETQDSYDNHMAKHAQAYGPNADHAPMSTDDIGSAAAMEAFKMSGGPSQGGQAPAAPAAHPDSHVTSTGGYPAYPSAGAPAAQAQSAPSGPPAEEEEEESGGGDTRGGGGAQDFLAMAMGKLGGMGGAPSGGASPGAGGGGGAPSNPQDKLVALAMSQAGKLFDKKNGTAAQGGNQDAKADAMHAAAATAMRLAGTYKTTGKLSLESGDMQQLMGAAMSFLHK